MKLEAVIGLEIHIQLKTKSKMFCSCSNIADDNHPNSVVCPICLGHPGTLPTLNEEVVEYATRLALALNLKINKKSIFERKNYFYPDLPQGYQISQFEAPFSSDGFFIIYNNNKKVKIGIERLHLENDSAKNIHKKDYSLIDFNRAGTPLVEIVTRPDIKNPEDARKFLQDLRQICRYLNVSDADMERGNLRCDVNVSMRPVGETKLYSKTEIKNLNSFRSVERALKYEIDRQSGLWENKQAPIKQVTMGWDENKQITVLQRTKEESNDYRYFPEPDLNPLIIDNDFIEKIKRELPELPYDKINRFIDLYKLNFDSSEILVSKKEIADYFEHVVSEFRAWYFNFGDKREWKTIKKDAVKLISNWIISELFKHLNDTNKNISDIKISAENFAEFIAMIFENKINSSNAQKVFKEMFQSGVDPMNFAKENDLLQESNEKDLENLAQNIIDNNQEQVNQYRGGKENLMKYFVGLAMKETKGKINPSIFEELLKKKLK